MPKSTDEPASSSSGGGGGGGVSLQGTCLDVSVGLAAVSPDRSPHLTSSDSYQ